LQTTTIIYIIIALLASSAISWFLYFYKQKEQRKIDYLLFGLRAISIFLLLLLLINPSIERKEITNEKPILSVLVDNSLSIQHFQKETEVGELLNQIRTDNSLQAKFDVQYFQFGEQLKILDSLNFKENQTNIYKAINGVEALQKNVIAPIVLISDGNQTNGNMYPFIETNKNTFPIVVGDTIAQSDVRIAQLNVNKYSYLKNKFPVEIRALYEGTKNSTTQLSIAYKGKTIYKKNLLFSADNNVQTITTNIESTQEGIQYYKASLTNIEGEQNIENNTKSFSVEVLNEQTTILLLTSVLHPDIGALKKSIETNKQRSVTVQQINNFKGNINDYQLVILYQPTIDFKKVFDEIHKNNSNYFVITGTQTNWNFLSEMQSNYYKNSINQSEEYGAIFNNGFLTFGQEDISFESFSPLKDAFGRLTLNSKFDVLLFQNIAGIRTETPLLATFENTNQKSAVLLGEGIWKWRATSFINSSSFEDFDGFISNLVQYLASTKKRERLSLSYEKLFSANIPITISAFYVDKNYQFDARANLNLKVTNSTTNRSQNIPFSLQNNSFEAVVEELPPGDYQFIVTIENQTIGKLGQFKITSYQIEEQFTKANQKELELLAANTNGRVYYSSTSLQLLSDLVSDNRYTILQKSKTINQQLIDWKFVLWLAILFLAIEWFIRKYIGKV